MIDPVQAVLLFVIALLTILLIVLGVQIFLILKDLRGTVRRTNRVLDHVDSLTENISEPITLLSGIFSSSSLLSSVVKLLGKYSEKDKK